MTGSLAKTAGVTYLSEGTHRFTLNDGRTFSIYASPYQPECGDWAFGYQRSQDRFNSSPAPGNTSIAKHTIPCDVDIVMTHGPPQGISYQAKTNMPDAMLSYTLRREFGR